jgi:hypothetical protein
MDLSELAAKIEYLGLPMNEGGSVLTSDERELLTDCVGFVEGFHTLLSDYGMISNREVDVDKLEASYEAILGENAAAAIFLSHFKDAPKMLKETAAKLQSGEEVPQLIKTGYEKLAQRVENTRKKMYGENNS